MKLRFPLLLCLFFILIFNHNSTLHSQAIPDTEILRIYEKQLSYGLILRSMVTEEIKKIVGTGKMGSTAWKILVKFFRLRSGFLNNASLQTTAYASLIETAIII